MRIVLHADQEAGTSRSLRWLLGMPAHRRWGLCFTIPTRCNGDAPMLTDSFAMQLSHLVACPHARSMGVFRRLQNATHATLTTKAICR